MSRSVACPARWARISVLLAAGRTGQDRDGTRSGGGWRRAAGRCRWSHRPDSIASDHPLLRRLPVGHHHAARRTEPARLEGRAARRVPERLVARPRGRRARAPQSASSRSAPARSWPSAVSEYSIRGGRSEYAGSDRGSPRVRAAQPVGEDVRCDARAAPTELVEAARAIEERLDEQQSSSGRRRGRRATSSGDDAGARLGHVGHRGRHRLRLIGDPGRLRRRLAVLDIQ